MNDQTTIWWDSINWNTDPSDPEWAALLLHHAESQVTDTSWDWLGSAWLVAALDSFNQSLRERNRIRAHHPVCKYMGTKRNAMKTKVHGPGVYAQLHLETHTRQSCFTGGRTVLSIWSSQPNSPFYRRHEAPRRSRDCSTYARFRRGSAPRSWDLSSLHSTPPLGWLRTELSVTKWSKSHESEMQEWCYVFHRKRGGHRKHRK